MFKYAYLLQHYFFNRVEKFPEKVALLVEKKEYTYQVLQDDCLRFSQHLKAHGVVRRDRIVIQSGNTYLTIVAYWAALLCDAIPCIIDPDMHNDIVKNVIQKIAPKAMVSDQDIISDKKISNISLRFNNTESDIAMIMHTSGSTGEPKGVMLSHRNVIAAVQSITAYVDLKPTDIILSVLPLHFDYGLYQMLLAFLGGATLVLEKNCLFPTVIAEKIAHHGVTVLPCVPLLVQLFYVAHQHYPYDFSMVRIVTNTGENLSPSHIQQLKTLFPVAKIFSMYGLTECKRCSYVPPDKLDIKTESIGIPIPNLEMWVADSLGNRLSENTEGELMIAGPTVMQGYWNNPLATRDKIKIMQDGKRILKTGDRAVMDEEGYFYFKGRSDSMIKFKGIKLNVQDYVKKIILYPEVQRCMIFLNQSHQLIVCIETHEVALNQDALRLKINHEFPLLQKPDYIYFTLHFPALSNGKCDRVLLEKMVESLCISVTSRMN